MPQILSSEFCQLHAYVYLVLLVLHSGLDKIIYKVYIFVTAPIDFQTISSLLV